MSRLTKCQSFDGNKPCALLRAARFKTDESDPFHLILVILVTEVQLGPLSGIKVKVSMNSNFITFIICKKKSYTAYENHSWYFIVKHVIRTGNNYSYKSFTLLDKKIAIKTLPLHTTYT